MSTTQDMPEAKSKPIRHTRWRITGTLTTKTPLHIGNGDIATFDHKALMNGGEFNEIQAVVKDVRGRPCIPGTALKGVLRSWAEQMLDGQNEAIERIFGKRDVNADAAESGWAEFPTAFYDELSDDKKKEYAEVVPFWNERSLTGILSHVCINRFTGAAEHNKLFFEEFVPEGISFHVKIESTRLTESDIQLLLAILEQGASHSTHPLQFGANTADGWGQMTWELRSIQKCEQPPPTFDKVGFDCCATEVSLTAAQVNIAQPNCISLPLKLDCQGPFLVNDASQGKPEGISEEEKRNFTDFAPLRRADRSIWLPASSLRGALRERCEFLLRSLNPDDTPKQPGPIERLFGHTGQRARLHIEEPRAIRKSKRIRQDFVAIDRFTGGAAPGAKFDAEYADAPQFQTTLRLDLANLKPEDFALFCRALNDLCTGECTLGWGGSKGYGVVTGNTSGGKMHGLGPSWAMPNGVLSNPQDQDGLNWIRERLAELSTQDMLLPTCDPLPGMSVAKVPAIKLLEGTLDVQQTKKGWDYPLTYQDDKGKQKSIKVPEEQVHPSLSRRAESGIEVEFEMEGGKQVRIFPRGEPRETTPLASPQQPKDGEFAHAYYFLRAEDRSNWTGELADSRPIGHRRWEPGRYSGKIHVKLTAKTPLLICDDANRTPHETVNEHFEYSVRKDADGNPLLASSSVRGMLRSAYEAITNSRFGVFPGKAADHDQPAEKNGRRLGFRLAAQITTVPARVVSDQSSPSGLSVELLPGTGESIPIKGAPLAAAWFGMYAGISPSNPNSVPVQHTQEAWAYLTPWHYSKTTKSGKQIIFDFWNVEEIQPPVTVSDKKPSTTPPRRKSSSHNAKPAAWATPEWYRGYLCITQRNMQGKHDERFFFCSSAPSVLTLELHHLQQWRQLIEDYQEQHVNELKQGKAAPPPLSSPNTFSRHISTSPPSLNNSAKELKHGDLCYVELETEGASNQIKALYPVTISRKLYDKSPLDLLPESLRPAPSIDVLSPADRVFGWVNQDEENAQAEDDSAYQSQVRVGPVTCITSAEAAIEPLNSPKPLAILGQPKPQQGRFYLGDKNGKAQPSGRTKEEAGYKEGNRIRGPKIYPYHQQAEKYENAEKWVNENPQAFSGAPSSQNRSVTDWVKPGTEFSFDLRVMNLSPVELGALIWLLSLPDGHFLRLGLGKPLGFGSVLVEIDHDQTTIADGQDWIRSLTTADDMPKVNPESLAALSSGFESLINQTNPDLLSAYKIATTGLGDIPVHYPLTTYQSLGSGETYKWFVANEKQGQQAILQDLNSPHPYLSKIPPS